jgi:hypothetical protein
MHEPGDNSPASTEPQDWTNSYQPVQVDVDGLLGYYETMMMKVLPAVAGPTATVLAPMGQFISEGLMGQGGSSDATAGTFPEGIVVAQLMTDYQTKFTDFFKDVQTGISCIGGAAGVIAEMYRNGDGENAANINDVMFAFADPGANTPKEFPKGAKTKTFAEQAADNANSGGQYAMAATQDQSQATSVSYPANGVAIYFFADGSSKEVVTSGTSNSYTSGTTTTSTIFYQGNVVGSTSQEKYSTIGGYSYTTTSQSPNSEPTGKGSASTMVVRNPDGSQTITTTTVDSTGKSTTTAPLTVQPDTHADTGTADGPIQQVETQYQTSGDDGYVQDHGNSY